MEELLAGRLTFKVKNSQGNIVDGTVVQYQSSDYYVQADGSLLWQVQPIQQSSNTVILSPSQTITSGFSLVGVQVNVIGAFLRKLTESSNTSYLTDENGKIITYFESEGVKFGLMKLDSSPSGRYLVAESQEQHAAFEEFGFESYASAQSPTSSFSFRVNGVNYTAVFSSEFHVTPIVTNIYPS